MSYDEASFKAGFALGRALWKPPRMKTDIDTGFGWTADPAYLVYNADTYLGRVGGRQFYKTNSGWAVSVMAINQGGTYGGNWTGPMIISTDQSAVAYTVISSADGTHHLTSQGSFVYLEKTWYYNAQWHISNASVGDDAGRPIFYGNNVTHPQVDINVLQAARVRMTGGA